MAIRIRSDDAARSGVWQQREKQPQFAERQRHFRGQVVRSADMLASIDRQTDRETHGLDR